MLKKMYAFLFALILAAAVGCQLGDEKAASTLDQDVVRMMELSLDADNPGEGADLADGYCLGRGKDLDGDKPEGCSSHCRHHPKFGPFHDVDMTTSWTYKDCEGLEQEVYDASTTGSIELVSDGSGSLDRRRIVKTFTRHAEITVSGLCGDNEDFTVNGNATSESQMTFTAHKRDLVRYYSVEMSTDLNDIVISIDRETNPWPLSGNISCVMVIDKARDADGVEVIIHVEKKVVITFNGTSTPDIVIDETKTGTIDLSDDDAESVEVE
jgi:hypothetical protein